MKKFNIVLFAILPILCITGILYISGYRLSRESVINYHLDKYDASIIESKKNVNSVKDNEIVLTDKGLFIIEVRDTLGFLYSIGDTENNVTSDLSMLGNDDDLYVSFSKYNDVPDLFCILFNSKITKLELLVNNEVLDTVYVNGSKIAVFDNTSSIANNFVIRCLDSYGGTVCTYMY